MAKKIHKRPSYEGHGFRIYVQNPRKAKNGTERIWIQIRQDEAKEWRVYENLSYAKGVDIAFVKEK